MAHDVFISYAQADRNVADAVCARLEARQISCWYAPRNITAGTQWAEAIIEGLDEARVMVMIFSSHSNGSAHVRNELERAVGKNVPIIPFRIEDVPPSKQIELFVSSSHWLDAITPPIEAHIDELGDTVSALVEQAAGKRSAKRARAPAPATTGGARRGPWVPLAILLLAVALATFAYGQLTASDPTEPERPGSNADKAGAGDGEGGESTQPVAPGREESKNAEQADEVRASLVGTSWEGTADLGRIRYRVKLTFEDEQLNGTARFDQHTRAVQPLFDERSFTTILDGTTITITTDERRINARKKWRSSTLEGDVSGTTITGTSKGPAGSGRLTLRLVP